MLLPVLPLQDHVVPATQMSLTTPACRRLTGSLSAKTTARACTIPWTCTSRWTYMPGFQVGAQGYVSTVLATGFAGRQQANRPAGSQMGAQGRQRAAAPPLDDPDISS